MTDDSDGSRVCTTCLRVEPDQLLTICRGCTSPLPAVSVAHAAFEDATCESVETFSGPVRTSGTAIQDDPWGTPHSLATSRLRLAHPELTIDIVPGPPVLLGRHVSSPIAVHPSVSTFISEFHAQVGSDPRDVNSAFVMDIGSTNGTWVSGAQLEPHVPRVLRAGDVIQLASTHPVSIEYLS